MVERRTRGMRAMRTAFGVIKFPPLRFLSHILRYDAVFDLQFPVDDRKEAPGR
jgi:hypothetical protein